LRLATRRSDELSVPNYTLTLAELRAPSAFRCLRAARARQSQAIELAKVNLSSLPESSWRACQSRAGPLAHTDCRFVARHALGPHTKRDTLAANFDGPPAAIVLVCSSGQFEFAAWLAAAPKLRHTVAPRKSTPSKSNDTPLIKKKKKKKPIFCSLARPVWPAKQSTQSAQ